MKIIIVFITVIFCLGSNVIAGPFTDEMSRCIVKKTTVADRTLFIKWMFAAMSSHPDVQSMASISPEMRENLSKQAAEMMTELLTERCKKECTQAVKHEGGDSIKVSFQVLGRVAMQGLMTNQQVKNYMSGLDKYFDVEKLRKTFAIE